MVNNLLVEMDYLTMKMEDFTPTGEVIARLELPNKHICLETNDDDEGKIFLEIAEYELDEKGNYVGAIHSDPIHHMPKTVEDIEELFSNWLGLYQIDENYTGGVEVKNEEGYAYWMYQKGKPVHQISPLFAEREQFIDWMRQHYA